MKQVPDVPRRPIAQPMAGQLLTLRVGFYRHREEGRVSASPKHAGVLVFDGAMGTEIYRHHVYTNRCYDELCLSNPNTRTGSCR